VLIAFIIPLERLEGREARAGLLDFAAQQLDALFLIVARRVTGSNRFGDFADLLRDVAGALDRALCGGELVVELFAPRMEGGGRSGILAPVAREFSRESGAIFFLRGEIAPRMRGACREIDERGFSLLDRDLQVADALL